MTLSPKATLQRSISLPHTYDIDATSGRCEVIAVGRVNWLSRARNAPAEGTISEMPYITKPLSFHFDTNVASYHINELKKRISLEPKGLSGCTASQVTEYRRAFLSAQFMALRAALVFENRLNQSM